MQFVAQSSVGKGDGMAQVKLCVGDIVVKQGSVQSMVAEEFCGRGNSVICTWMDDGVVVQKTLAVSELEKAPEKRTHKYHIYHRMKPNLRA